MAGENQEMLGMSDEDFLNMPIPSFGSKESAEPAPKEEPKEVVEEEEEEENLENTPEPKEKEVEEEEEEEGGKKPASANQEKKQEPVSQEDTPATANKDAKAPNSGEKAKGDEEGQKEVAPNYQEFYQKVMAPFKANGKTIELKTPEEAIQLMQMGANYTRKMQALQPHRKVLLMLENNGLLDEGKLSFLIDIEKKNPEAIKKLVKDAGIDPLDMDVSVEPAYQAGNHRVSDEEASFRAVLDDLSSTPDGKATLQLINSSWDQASIEATWKSPDILSIMHEQRENGIYDRISTEINRQKTLGAIPASTPFLQAYKAVGDQMTAAGAFNDLVKAPAGKATTQKQPSAVATRVAAPKSPVTNGDKATAASASRNSPRKARDAINPLAMSDEEFLKHMENRL